MSRIFPGLLLALMLGFTATQDAVAHAQSAALPVRHRAIRLTSQKITLPFGDKTFAGAGETAKIANEHCLLCHSRAMIDTQPPLPLATWKKEIDKMRTAYGCPLRADEPTRSPPLSSRPTKCTSSTAIKRLSAKSPGRELPARPFHCPRSRVQAGYPQ